jgi:hypothetical protein
MLNISLLNTIEQKVDSNIKPCKSFHIGTILHCHALISLYDEIKIR